MNEKNKGNRNSGLENGKSGIVVQHLMSEHEIAEPVSPDKVLIQTAHFASSLVIAYKNVSLHFGTGKMKDEVRLVDELVNSFNGDFA